VAAFFFVFNRLEAYTYVFVVALALQHVDNTDIFNVGDWGYEQHGYLKN
jgi:hypothetical protein